MLNWILIGIGIWAGTMVLIAVSIYLWVLFITAIWVFMGSAYGVIDYVGQDVDKFVDWVVRNFMRDRECR